MIIKDKNGYKEIVLECAYTIGYTYKCETCGNETQTVNRVNIKKCPTCESRKIGKPIEQKCSNVERIAYQSEKALEDELKEISKRNKGFKDYKKPDEYYCLKHAGENQ